MDVDNLYAFAQKYGLMREPWDKVAEMMTFEELKLQRAVALARLKQRERPKQTRITDRDIQYLRDHPELTLREKADHIGHSYDRVRIISRDLGIPYRSGYAHSLTEEDKAYIRQHPAESIVSLAKRLHKNRGVVNAYCVVAGQFPRPRCRLSDAEIMRLYNCGKTIAQIAKLSNVSTCTIWKIKERMISEGNLQRRENPQRSKKKEDNDNSNIDMHADSRRLVGCAEDYNTAG